jgi:hypothetical protein
MEAIESAAATDWIKVSEILKHILADKANSKSAGKRILVGNEKSAN